MTADPQTMASEQEYLDRAWKERERSIEVLMGSAGAAANGKAAGDLRRRAKEARDAIDPSEPVAFGRLDLESGDTFYLGHQLVNTEARDMLVINWQQPVVAPFYEANPADPRGASLKRTFIAPSNRIVDMDDVVFRLIADRVEAINFDDALLRDLRQGRTGEMRDIVRTITSAQYDVIRSPLDATLVIQGGPGTGKTVVALHRVSWLLWNHRDRLTDDSVLVIGPGASFIQYIKQVLPGLGDGKVVHRPLTALGPIPTTHRAETSAVTQLKGDARMAGLLARGAAARIKPPIRGEVVEVPTSARPVRLDGGAIADQIIRRSEATPYSVARASFRGWLSGEVTDRAGRGVRISAQQLDALVERLWPSLSPQSFVQDLLGSRERLLEAAGDDFTAAEVGLLYRQATERIGEETWSDADVALLDEAQFVLQGSPDATFAHVVVDEAQDLSPMQMRSIRRRSSTGSMTVVGDLAQSTGAWARDSWDDVVAGLEQDVPVIHAELRYGYRVPRQVMDLANRLLPLAAPGVSPAEVFRDGDEEPNLIEVLDADDHPSAAIEAAREYMGRGLLVGMVVPASQWDDLTAQLDRQHVRWRDGSEGFAGGALNLVTPTQSKGLEFDAVVVVSPHLVVAEAEQGHRMLYVALTRTTNALSVVHAGDPLAFEAGTVPPSAVQVGDATATHDLETAGAVEPAAQDAAPADASGTDVDERDRSAARPGGGRMGRAAAGKVAQLCADEVREAVPPALWPFVIDQLRRELEVTSDDVLELMD